MSDQPNERSEQELLDAFLARDLELEARNQTAAMQQIWWVKLLSWLIRLVIKGKSILGFGTDQSVLMVDLNKYRPDIDVEMLIDQGIRLFGLRVGGPTKWVYGDWAYAVDPTFVPYYERIKAYATKKNIKVWILGYCVHNPWANEEGNYLGLDWQVKWFKEATRNHTCDLYCWDDEVGTVWKNGRETTITATNLLRSLKAVMEQTWLEMERWPSGLNKMVVHYSANWFMQRYAMAEYQTWLDNNNRDVNNRKFMTWRAWLPVVFSETFTDVKAMFAKAITPTGLQENAYLRMGSELAADLWQLTFTLKGPWCGPISAAGIDASISYGPSASLSQFIHNANLPVVEQPPADTQPPTAPANLIGLVQNNGVTLEWGPATDNVGVTGYVVSCNGVTLGTVSGTIRTFVDELAVPGATYVYKVVAVDAAGNIGAPAQTTVVIPDDEEPPNPGSLIEVINRLETLQRTMDEIRKHFS